jgi:dTDP-4-dehydrorhamnose reductase/UDP-glucose 4-epimerase
MMAAAPEPVARSADFGSGLTVVGAGSFLAGTLEDAVPGGRFVSARDANLSALLRDSDTVVNFAFDRRLYVDSYSADLDLDLRIASALGPAVRRYVMLSSRAVYAPEVSWPCREDRLGGPVSPYGENKRRSEAAVRSLLGSRLLCLRVSNVLGFEYGLGRRSFMAAAMTALRETGTVVFDHDLSVRKDFLTYPSFRRGIRAFLASERTGTFNLGAGFGIAVRDVVESLIDGYGCGAVKVTNSANRAGQFYLSMDQSSEFLGCLCGRDEILRYVFYLGVKLRDA